MIIDNIKSAKENHLSSLYENLQKLVLDKGSGRAIFEIRSGMGNIEEGILGPRVILKIQDDFLFRHQLDLLPQNWDRIEVSDVQENGEYYLNIHYELSNIIDN